MTYVPGLNPFNDLLNLYPCSGYWVKVTNNANLTYPGTAPVVPVRQHSQQQKPVAAAEMGVIATTQWVNVYSKNLTLDDKIVKAGTEITAHTIDGLKIGAFNMNQNGRFGFMPVYSDDAFSAENDGVKAGHTFYLSVSGIATNETLTWTSTGDRIEVSALTSTKTGEPAIPVSYSLAAAALRSHPPTIPTTTKSVCEAICR